MWRRSDGQSMVEMAFVLPILLLLLFGIIEFGYLIFAYSTISQAVRNAAETAAELPPYQTWLSYEGQTLPDGLGYESDACVRSIYKALESDQTLFTDINNYLTITYPNATASNDTRNLVDRGPVEVSIDYPLTGITPLFKLTGIGGGTGTIHLKVTQRRSLENLGVDPNSSNGSACAEDVADWKRLHPDDE
ncbi:MAG: pilus assembly protein [Oscillochloris sp.]|nr:pilus assembly protein [Oscillochloris sp.]